MSVNQEDVRKSTALREVLEHIEVSGLKEKLQVLEALEGAIEKLQDAIKNADVEVPRGDAPSLILHARKAHELLERGAGQPDLLLDVALKATDKLFAAATELLEGHRRVVIGRYRAELEKCGQAAGKLSGEIDSNAVQKVETAFETFRKIEFFAPLRIIEDPMAHVRESLNYVVQCAGTAKQRLAIDDEQLGGHDALCGKETVRKLIASIKPGRLSELGPGPMGIATPKYDYKGYPKVEVSEEKGQFHLVPSEAKDAAAHECTVMPIGEFILGKIVLVTDGESVTAEAEDGSWFNYGLPGATNAMHDKWLKRGVSPEAYREVELRELEHLVDFDYAFKLGPVALAEAIKRVSNQQFDSATDPIDALVDDLSKHGVAELIPADPHAPDAWADRMSMVMLLLSGMSKERDTQGTHSPVGNKATIKGDSVLIDPVFGKKTLDARQIISLAKVGVVYTGEPPPKDDIKEDLDEDVTPPVETKRERTMPLRVLKKGDTATVLQLVRGLDASESVGADQVDSAIVQAEQVVLIEAEPTEDGLVWASAPEKDVRCLAMPDGRAYFQISVELLE